MTSDLSAVEIDIIGNVDRVMKAVDNIGQVHKRERWATLLRDQRALSVTNIDGQPTVRFWTISLDRIPRNDHRPGSQATHHIDARQRRFEYKIIGIFGHNDAQDTETPAKVVVMDVMHALDNDPYLNQTYWEVKGCELDEFELTKFGSDLVHYAEITFTVESMMAT